MMGILSQVTLMFKMMCSNSPSGKLLGMVLIKDTVLLVMLNDILFFCSGYFSTISFKLTNLFCSGVLEANFIEPAHDKQDFERSSLFSKLEMRLKQMVMEYWYYFFTYLLFIF